jgi:hypothetical protein
MKRISLVIAITAILLVPSARAQNHAEFGGFVDYFRLQETGSNFAGAGGRVAVNFNPYVQAEAEVSYDFNQVFTENFTNGMGMVTAQNSNIKVLHALFGPKLQTKGPVRLFVTVKGGITNFRLDAAPASFSGFTDSVNNLRSNNVDAALYPGGGAEAFLGPIGLRVEVGDEIIFYNGARHNWRVTFGPQIRF